MFAALLHSESEKSEKNSSQTGNKLFVLCRSFTILLQFGSL